jgi:hypothetical protein
MHRRGGRGVAGSVGNHVRAEGMVGHGSGVFGVLVWEGPRWCLEFER